jgi:CheY-like chemotaxis protein
VKGCATLEMDMSATCDFPAVSDPFRAPGEMRRAEAEPAPITILVVDDVADTCDMYASYFKHVGAGVLKALDGASGLALTRAFRPDAVLLDLAMPRMPGQHVLEAIRRDERTRTIPVVVLTGHAVTGTKEAALDAGADLFLTKPCLPHVVFNLILKLLRDRGDGDPPMGG